MFSSKRFYWNLCTACKNSRVLYHSTDYESAHKIVQSGFFLRGSDACMFGSGIYFAESAEIAERKAWHGDHEKAIIKAEVALGRCYQPRCADRCLSSFMLLLMGGYQSTWARPKGCPAFGPMGFYQEWIVYSKYQVRLLSVKVEGRELLSKSAKQAGMLSTSERGPGRI